MFEGLSAQTDAATTTTAAAGHADEPTGLTRPWEFGDEQPLDVPRTVGNALRRAGIQPGRVSLDVSDFEVVETERRTTAAVALCVDMSFSMVNEGRWGPMKQTALALSHLVQTRFRQDALEIIGFNLAARRLTPVQLADAEPEWVQGTNLQHALMLATRHLRRHPQAQPVVLVVTDGEPTAHLGDDGVPTFRWPTTQRHPARDRRPGRRAATVRRGPQRVHARRGPGAGAVRRRRRPARGWARLHARASTGSASTSSVTTSRRAAADGPPAEGWHHRGIGACASSREADVGGRR